MIDFKAIEEEMKKAMLVLMPIYDSEMLFCSPENIVALTSLSPLAVKKIFDDLAARYYIKLCKDFVIK